MRVGPLWSEWTLWLLGLVISRILVCSSYTLYYETHVTVKQVMEVTIASLLID